MAKNQVMLLFLGVFLLFAPQFSAGQQDVVNEKTACLVSFDFPTNAHIGECDAHPYNLYCNAFDTNQQMQYAFSCEILPQCPINKQEAFELDALFDSHAYEHHQNQGDFSVCCSLTNPITGAAQDLNFHQSPCTKCNEIIRLFNNTNAHVAPPGTAGYNEIVYGRIDDAQSRFSCFYIES